MRLSQGGGIWATIPHLLLLLLLLFIPNYFITISTVSYVVISMRRIAETSGASQDDTSLLLTLVAHISVCF